MLRTVSLSLSAVALLTVFAAADSASAQPKGPGGMPYEDQQFYSQWFKDPSVGYWYRYYYFKPNQQDQQFSRQLVVWHPQHPNQLLFYNMKVGKFWGGLLLDAADESEQYVTLPNEARRSGLEETFSQIANYRPGPLPNPANGQQQLQTPAMVVSHARPAGIPDDLPLAPQELPQGGMLAGGGGSGQVSSTGSQQVVASGGCSACGSTGRVIVSSNCSPCVEPAPSCCSKRYTYRYRRCCR